MNLSCHDLACLVGLDLVEMGLVGLLDGAPNFIYLVLHSFIDTTQFP